MAAEVIAFYYRLTDKSGKQIDASQEGHPLIFLTGAGQIIPGLESVLIEMDVAQKKTVTVPAKQAYGEYDDKLIYKVKKSQLPKTDIVVGDMFELGEGERYLPVGVTAIEGEDVTLNGNHPLAGKDLIFAVEIVKKRPATHEEITHGHPHGEGGCHHW